MLRTTCGRRFDNAINSWRRTMKKKNAKIQGITKVLSYVPNYVKKRIIR